MAFFLEKNSPLWGGGCQPAAGRGEASEIINTNNKSQIK